MKPNQWRLLPRITLCSAVLATMMIGCSEKQATTRPEALATPVAAPQAVAEPKEAKDILLRMTRYLALAPRFSVNINTNYDVIQASGQKIEFGETRTIDAIRPNQLRVESEQSDGDKHIVLYDGKDITTFSPSQNVYAQVSKPRGIDGAVTYFLKDLRMRLPLAMLLLSRLPEKLEQRTLSLDYVERTKIHGAPAHHLAGRTETVDYQVWISEGAQPLPLRVVLT